MQFPMATVKKNALYVFPSTTRRHGNFAGVLLGTKYFGRHSSVTSKPINVNQALTSSQ
jgi:hypothetical protein